MTPTEKAIRALVSFAVGIIIATVATLGFTYRVAAKAAEDTVGVRLDAHLEAERRLPAVLKQMSKKLDALCRVNPRANCPLGEED